MSIPTLENYLRNLSADRIPTASTQQFAAKSRMVDALDSIASLVGDREAALNAVAGEILARAWPDIWRWIVYFDLKLSKDPDFFQPLIPASIAKKIALLLTALCSSPIIKPKMIQTSGVIRYVTKRWLEEWEGCTTRPPADLVWTATLGRLVYYQCTTDPHLDYVLGKQRIEHMVKATDTPSSNKSLANAIISQLRLFCNHPPSDLSNRCTIMYTDFLEKILRSPLGIINDLLEGGLVPLGIQFIEHLQSSEAVSPDMLTNFVLSFMTSITGMSNGPHWTVAFLDAGGLQMYLRSGRLCTEAGQVTPSQYRSLLDELG